MKTRARAGKTKIHAKLAGHAARLVEMALDPLGILGRQGLGRHEIAHRAVLSRQARLLEIVAEMLDEDRANRQAMGQSTRSGASEGFGALPCCASG